MPVNEAAFLLLDYQMHGCCIVDREMTVRFWNNRMEEWTDISRGEIKGCSIFEWYPGLKTRKFQERFKQVFDGSPPAIFSAHIHKHLIPCPLPDGTDRIQQALFIRLPYDAYGEELAMLSLYDVTDYYNKIKSYGRMSKEKENLLSICSHDLKSPLNGILGMSQILQEENISDEHKEYVGMIEKSGNFLLELINDILDYAKVNSQSGFDYDLESLNEICSQSIDRMAPLAKLKDIDLTFENTAEDLRVFGSHLDLVRAFNNILSNAIKFTPRGQNITMKLFANENDEAVVTIRDTGAGMGEEDRKNLFKKFSATRQGTEGEAGTGLGMAIVGQIIKTHHGDIDVQSSEGDGTTVFVSLPLKYHSNDLTA